MELNFPDELMEALGNPEPLPEPVGQTLSGQKRKISTPSHETPTKRGRKLKPNTELSASSIQKKIKKEMNEIKSKLENLVTMIAENSWNYKS